MLKQFTAIVLILAIANPFCCCFGTTLWLNGPLSETEGQAGVEIEKAESIKQKPQPRFSCCSPPPLAPALSKSSNAPASAETPSSPKDAPPSCPGYCSCKQTYTVAEHQTFTFDKIYKVVPPVFEKEQVLVDSSTFLSEAFTKSMAWRPPPYPSISLCIRLCVFRT